jgi:ADP-ribose pyrophosphatase YjhB (NUDIX family)
VALKRECIEEIGCDIEVLQEIGLVNEWRKIYQIHQVSFCYLAKIVGKKELLILLKARLQKDLKYVGSRMTRLLKL